MTEEKEESPYQIYCNLYCDECDDNSCVAKVELNAYNELTEKENMVYRDAVRVAIFKCAKLRDLLRNYYKD